MKQYHSLLWVLRCEFSVMVDTLQCPGVHLSQSVDMLVKSILTDFLSLVSYPQSLGSLPCCLALTSISAFNSLMANLSFTCVSAGDGPLYSWTSRNHQSGLRQH